MNNKKKTGVSRNWMKKTLKSKLEEGTHVSPEAYEMLMVACNDYIKKLTNFTVSVFTQDERKSRLDKHHVNQAILYAGGMIEE